MAGLLFLYFLQNGNFYQEDAAQVINFLRTIVAKKPETAEQIKPFYNEISSGSAQGFIKELLRAMNVVNKSDLRTLILSSSSIINIYNIMSNDILTPKPKAGVSSRATLTNPGDIVTFLKVLFLSVIDKQLYDEIVIFVNAINPRYSTQNTIDVINKYIRDNSLSPVILNLIVPDSSSTGYVTLNIQEKLNTIKRIMSSIPR